MTTKNAISSNQTNHIKQSNIQEKHIMTTQQSDIKTTIENVDFDQLINEFDEAKLPANEVIERLKYINSVLCLCAGSFGCGGTNQFEFDNVSDSLELVIQEISKINWQVKSLIQVGSLIKLCIGAIEARDNIDAVSDSLKLACKLTTSMIEQVKEHADSLGGAE